VDFRCILCCIKSQAVNFWCSLFWLTFSYHNKFRSVSICYSCIYSYIGTSWLKTGLEVAFVKLVAFADSNPFSDRVRAVFEGVFINKDNLLPLIYIPPMSSICKFFPLSLLTISPKWLFSWSNLLEMRLL
jgi:hypothetical protein